MSTVVSNSSTRSTSRKSNRQAIDSLTLLPSKQLWSNTAPKAVRSAWNADDHATAWQSLVKHLKEPAKKLSAKRPEPVAWSLPLETANAFTGWLKAGPYGDRPENAAHRWTAETARQAADLSFALECVAWATQLRSLSGKLSADAWWSLVETLLHVALEADTASAPEIDEAEAVVVEQLLAGELPLLLSQKLPELRPLRDLAGASKKSLSQCIERLTDGEGFLTGELWISPDCHAASLLLACWTRCRKLVDDGKPPWNADAEDQYEWLVRQSLRMSDRVGRLAFAPAKLFGAAELMHQAIDLAGDASDEAAAASRLKGFAADPSFEPPQAANHSEWAELGVLSCGWKDKAPRIVVAHPGDQMSIEVHVGKHTLFAGEWPLDAEIDGKPIEADDEWECQCWHSDADCDYLELALDLVGGARLERQFFLARRDGAGFLCETLFSEKTKDSQLKITSRLPLGQGIAMRPENETRDAVLTADSKPVAGLMPLALPEWRDDPRGGELTAEDRRVVLTRDWAGKNAASPLWIDFSATRFGKQRTWRQLTIAELLETVPADVAVGYRIQSAKEQWLIYRSLGKRGNRTLLGQNFSSEMFLGKFNAPDGTNEEYLEIEGAEE